MGNVKMFNFWKKKKQEPAKKSEKELATERGEPWVEVLSFDLDPSNTSQGAFELDWNVHFVNDLRQKGFPGKTDEQVVDNWFRNICRHIVLETYENDVATNKYIDRKDIGNGLTEVK